MLSRTLIVTHISSNIVKITLNRPEALNALNTNLLSSLCEALRSNSNAQVIIIEGSGDRAFCAGEDLKQTLAPRTGCLEELEVSLHKLQDITRLTSASSAIIIAAVQGYAIGGGAEIALAADFVLGSPNTNFQFPEANIGHAVTGGITQRLPAIVGLLRAKQLLLSGRMVGGQEAFNIGLLTELVDDPKQRAVDLARQLSALPSVAAASSKVSLERAFFPNLENVLLDEVSAAKHCFSQEVSRTAFSNFASRKQSGLKVSTPILDLCTALSYAVSSFPDRVFLRFREGEVTYFEFERRVALLAGGLRQLGVLPGHKVLVQMRNSIEMVTTWFATNRLGAVWVPINCELRSITLKHVVEAADATIAIVDREFLDQVMDTGSFPNNRLVCTASSSDEVLILPSLLRTSTPVLECPTVLPSTTAAYLFTSGTTGRSKPCILTHAYFIHVATSLTAAFNITSSDVLYCPFPLFHIDATALTLVPALLTSSIAAFSQRYSASNFWNEIRHFGATIYDFMGATLALTYKQPPSTLDKSHNVRLAWGVPIPTWAGDYEARFNHPIVELYGSVECGIPIVQTGPRVVGSCGTVQKGYELRIADEHDNPLPINTPGHVLLRSSTPHAFFNGYFGAPEATLACTTNQWLHTGDIARIDGGGNVYFHGRTKDVIRRRGENVNAFEVEEEILRHEDVISIAAFGVPSALGNGTEEDVKVAVVVREGSGLSERGLWEWCCMEGEGGGGMSRFMRPSVIEFVSELKRTETGKVEKRELKVDGGVRFDERQTVRK